jgi:hypothetical protein
LVTLPLVSGNLWPTARLVFTNPLLFVQRDYTSFMSYNVSLAGGVAHALAWAGAQNLAVWVAAHGTVVGLVYLAMVAPLLWFRSIPIWVRLIVAMMLTTGSMPIVYPYAVNWIVAASALAMLMTVGSRMDPVAIADQVPRRLAALIMAVLAVLTAPWPLFVPGSMESGIPTSMLAIVQAVACVVLPGALWVGVARSARQPDVQRPSFGGTIA